MRGVAVRPLDRLTPALSLHPKLSSSDVSVCPLQRTLEILIDSDVDPDVSAKQVDVSAAAVGLKPHNRPFAPHISRFDPHHRATAPSNRGFGTDSRQLRGVVITMPGRGK